MASALRRKAAEMASTAAATARSQCYYSRTSWALRQRGVGRAVPLPPRRSFSVSAAAGFDNQNSEYVIVGGGNAAGYAARTFVEQGMADGRLCIVSKEAFPPYERPALTKGYLFPPDKKPARLPGFHTCVGSGGQRQTVEWYKENGIEVLYEDPVVAFDGKTQTLKTTSGKILKYGSLIISTGCEASRLPEKIGGNLPGVHYIRNVADADSLVSALGRAKKVVVIGGGYIGMEVAAAACGWNLDTTIIFPEDHIMPRLFTPSLAKKYEELYQQNGVKFIKGALIDKLEAGSDGRVSSAVLKDGSVVDADTVIVGIGAKPVVSPFEAVGVNSKVGGIEVDSLFRTSVPGIFAIGDVAAFPLKMYSRIARVEHVDHARKSAHHCVETLLTSQTKPYDYLPYFYSRVFEYEGSSRKVWWQFYGDNVGDTVEVGNFDPKIATFWIDSDSRLKGVFLESGTSEVLNMYPRLSRLVFRRRWRRLLSIRRRQEELFVPLIKARRDDGDARELGCSYVDSLLRLRVPGNEEDHGGAGRSLTDVEMASMCFEFLFAATDTTAAAMQWIMARLVKHPEVQQRLREEVEREAAGHGDVHDDDLARMLYLKAVVLEALRRHPPAQIVGAHAPTREDTVLDGYRVPRDAAVNFAAAEFGWDAEAWAAPMEFRPERFLPGGEAADVDLTGAKGIKMMPFGAGRRMCPGMALALAHLEYFVANLVREFEWHAVSGEEVDLAEKMELSVGMRRPLRARVVPRRAGDRSD